MINIITKIIVVIIAFVAIMGILCVKNLTISEYDSQKRLALHKEKNTEGEITI